MTTITVKNIPDELYAQLKQSAARHRRSVNNEIIFWLERIIGTAPIDVGATLTKAHYLREQANLYINTDDELNAMIDKGRP